MMRDILFRGKCKDTGKWYEGYYVHLHKTTYCFKEDYDRNPDNDMHQIIFEQMMDWGLPNQHFRVDVSPETVSEFSGLTDKNGKKIFEGDICQIKGISYIDETPFIVEWNNEYSGWYWKNLDFGSATDAITPEIAEMSKVIGNIHDNPELLKGGAE